MTAVRGALLICVVVLASSGWEWYRYYETVLYPKDYHRTYFIMALVPAVLLCLAVMMAAVQAVWVRVIGFLLCVPASGLWVLSLMLVHAKFKIH